MNAQKLQKYILKALHSVISSNIFLLNAVIMITNDTLATYIKKITINLYNESIFPLFHQFMTGKLYSGTRRASNTIAGDDSFNSPVQLT